MADVKNKILCTNWLLFLFCPKLLPNDIIIFLVHSFKKSTFANKSASSCALPIASHFLNSSFMTCSWSWLRFWVQFLMTSCTGWSQQISLSSTANMNFVLSAEFWNIHGHAWWVRASWMMECVSNQGYNGDQQMTDLASSQLHSWTEEWSILWGWDMENSIFAIRVLMGNVIFIKLRHCIIFTNHNIFHSPALLFTEACLYKKIFFTDTF